MGGGLEVEPVKAWKPRVPAGGFGVAGSLAAIHWAGLPEPGVEKALGGAFEADLAGVKALVPLAVEGHGPAPDVAGAGDLEQEPIEAEDGVDAVDIAQLVLKTEEFRGEFLEFWNGVRGSHFRLSSEAWCSA